MKKPAEFKKPFSYALVSCAIIYCLMGLIPYLAYGREGINEAVGNSMYIFFIIFHFDYTFIKGLYNKFILSL